MPLIVRGCKPMIIPSGQQASNALGLIDDSWGLTVYSPADLTGIIKVEVEPTDTGSNWVTLQSGAVDVALPAGKATVFNPIPFRQIRVVSDQAEVPARTFTVTKAILVG